MLRFVAIEAADHPEAARGAPPPGLLGPDEVEACARLVIPARRRAWLLGRVAAKRLVAQALVEVGEDALPFASIVIRNEASGVPFAEVAGRRLPCSLSISHRGDAAVAALADGAGETVGADLELVEPRDPALARTFFTTAEQALVAAAGEDADRELARIWSAKEAVLKALGLGLGIDTREVEIGCRLASAPGPAGLPAVEAHLRPARRLGGRRLGLGQRLEGDRVLSIALLARG